MSEDKKFRFIVRLNGVELRTDHRYTREQVEDIHRLVKNVTVIASDKHDDGAFSELQEIPA